MDTRSAALLTQLGKPLGFRLWGDAKFHSFSLTSCDSIVHQTLPTATVGQKATFTIILIHVTNFPMWFEAHRMFLPRALHGRRPWWIQSPLVNSQEAWTLLSHRAAQQRQYCSRILIAPEVRSRRTSHKACVTLTTPRIHQLVTVKAPRTAFVPMETWVPCWLLQG